MTNAMRLGLLVKRQDGECHFCEQLMTARRSADLLPSDATLEHLLPRAQHGHDGLCNLRASCLRCNSLRGHLDATFFKLIVKRLRLDEDCREAWHVDDDYAGKMLRLAVKLEIMRAYAYVCRVTAHEYLRTIEKLTKRAG